MKSVFCFGYRKIIQKTYILVYNLKLEWRVIIKENF